MRLTRAGTENFAFHLDAREGALLLGVLDRYPLIVSAHQPLSKSIAVEKNEANQRLLDEAVAEQRRENKEHLQSLLKDKNRFRKTDGGWILTLSVADMEWLLQILNDVRVGSWVLLGAPEKELWNVELNETNAPLAWTMEAAGFFEMALLEAMGGRAAH